MNFLGHGRLPYKNIKKQQKSGAFEEANQKRRAKKAKKKKGGGGGSAKCKKRCNRWNPGGQIKCCSYTLNGRLASTFTVQTTNYQINGYANA